MPLGQDTTTSWNPEGKIWRIPRRIQSVWTCIPCRTITRVRIITHKKLRSSHWRVLRCKSKHMGAWAWWSLRTPWFKLGQMTIRRLRCSKRHKPLKSEWNDWINSELKSTWHLRRIRKGAASLRCRIWPNSKRRNRKRWGRWIRLCLSTATNKRYYISSRTSSTWWPC